MFERASVGEVPHVRGPSDPFPDCRLSPEQALVRCPACGSGLIYPLARRGDGRYAEIECRCPDCEETTVMVTSALVAVVWERRNARAAAALTRLAESIAGDGG
jgi:ribosomal protein S27E